MELATLVVYVGGYLFLVFLAVCLATGLYYLAELVEEYTTASKKAINYIIHGIVVLHVLLLIVDRLPVVAIGSGIAAHLVYYTLLRKFPFIELTSVEFLGSCAMLGVNHYIWMQHFMKHYHTVEYVMGFFLVVVWLVPFAFFISLAANESVLPMNMGSAGGSNGNLYGGGGGGGGGGGSWGSSGDLGGGGGKKSRSALLGLMKFFKSRADSVLPKVNQFGITRNKEDRWD